MNNVHIGEENKMKVKKRTLLLLASIVWLIAGFNIIRIGMLSYTGHVTVVNILLSALVFAVFWSMVFYKLVIRHTDRIQNYEDELQFFWHFFDKKSFLIMAFMMTFGIGLRASPRRWPAFCLPAWRLFDAGATDGRHVSAHGTGSDDLHFQQR